MKKKLLSLALALALCLGLAVPVSAAGTTKVVEDETHGVKITMDGFLRVETRPYNLNVGDLDTDKPQGGIFNLTIYVVADDSTVTVEAMEGRKYADPSFVECFKDIGSFSLEWWNWDSPEKEIYRTFFSNNMESYAYNSRDSWGWDNENNCFFSDSFYPWPLEKSTTETVSPADDSRWAIYVDEGYGVGWLCESDYARLIPATLQASGWAQPEVKQAYDAQLMPFSPYLVNCTKGMTRAQFAATMVHLYSAMTGKPGYWPDVDDGHPFTDVDWDTTMRSAWPTTWALSRARPAPCSSPMTP